MSLSLTAPSLRVGLDFHEDSVTILAAIRRQGSWTIQARERTDLTLQHLAGGQGHKAFLEAMDKLKDQTQIKGAPAYICLPSPWASIHLVRPGSNHKRPTQNDFHELLTDLTPFKTEQLRYDLRTLHGEGRFAQALIASEELIGSIVSMVTEAGLKPVNVDIGAGYLGRIGRDLAVTYQAYLAVSLNSGHVDWALINRGRVVQVGTLPHSADDGPAQALARAGQFVVQSCHPLVPSHIYLTGPMAEAALAAAAQSETDAGSAEIKIPLQLAPEFQAPGKGLEPDEMIMGRFLALSQSKLRTCFNLAQQAGGTGWLSRPSNTRKLMWAAVILLMLVVGQKGAQIWLQHNQVDQQIKNLKAETSRLNLQARRLSSTLSGFQPVIQAQSAQTNAPGLLNEVVSLLPRSAWLERFEYRGRNCILHVAGIEADEIKTLIEKSSLFTISGPITKRDLSDTGAVSYKVILRAKDNNLPQGAISRVNKK